MLNISEDKLDDVLEEGEYYSLETLKTPDLGRKLARVLIFTVGITFLTLFIPWQQNIRGTGSLTAFNPANRPQTIESAIAGRIIDWKIREGQYIHQGDTILSLSEVKEKFFDPNLLMRMTEQIDAKKSSLEAKSQKCDALKTQIRALQAARTIKLQQAKNKLDQTHLKLETDSIAFEAEKVQYENARSLYDRNKLRYEAGNIPLSKYQEVESKFQQSVYKLNAAENKFQQTKTELIITAANISGLDADYMDKISKAQSDLGATLADLYDTEGSLSKLKNENANMEIRNAQYQIIAPQSGYVVRALKGGIGETIKEGEAVVTIMPETSDKSAEIFIKTMDLPFIKTGRKVRIEFDGWPSLQFSGWPNVSIGTFGGVVEVIDRVESKPGLFRILVKPDPYDIEWPEDLRMGSGVKGWVMLNNVPIWFELWRQLNGFPPTIYENGNADGEKTKK